MILFSCRKFCQGFCIKLCRNTWVLLKILCPTCFKMCFFACVYKNKFFKVCLTVNIQIPLSKFHNWMFCIIIAHTCYYLKKKNKGCTLYKNTILCINVILSIFLKAVTNEKKKKRWFLRFWTMTPKKEYNYFSNSGLS